MPRPLPFEDRLVRPRHLRLRLMFAPRQLRGRARARASRAPGREDRVRSLDARRAERERFQDARRPTCRPPPPELEVACDVGRRRACALAVRGQRGRADVRAPVGHLRTRLAEGWLQYNERVLGPTIMAKAALEPQGGGNVARRAEFAQNVRWQRCRRRRLPRARRVPPPGVAQCTTAEAPGLRRPRILAGWDYRWATVPARRAAPAAPPRRHRPGARRRSRRAAWAPG